VTGYTNSANFRTVNALQPSSGGGVDAFAGKMNATGSALVYSTYLGGSSNHFGWQTSDPSTIVCDYHAS
jgi:hypothetical protein